MTALKTVNYITTGIRITPCTPPVVHWREHKQSFPGLKPRKHTDLVVTHWTGGEGTFEEFVATCKKSGNSAHFWIDANEDADGFATAYQLFDGDLLAAHCKGANPRAVGIEARNRGALEPVRPVVRDIRREILTDTISGKTVKYCAFLPSQVKTFIGLCQALCKAYDLPFALPTETVERELFGKKSKVKQVIPRRLTQAEFDAHRGVMGHLHWSDKGKSDPGMALLRALAAIGDRERTGMSGPAE